MIRRALIGIPAACALAACGAASRSDTSSVAAPAATRASAPVPAAGRAAPAPAHTADCRHRRPPGRPIEHRQWLAGFIVTEYYPTPDRWFSGALVDAPGSTGRHRADWLYSARGVSMEGDGVDLRGRRVHIANLGSVGWVNSTGTRTVPPRCGIRWSHGPPAWRAGGWRNRGGAVTYPLAA